MTRLASINRAIADLGLELVKGEGYFYFVGDGTENLKTTSVYVYRLNNISFCQWVDEARDVADRILAG